MRQLHDFRNGLRQSADPRKPNTVTMIDLAKAMTDEEMRISAEYFAAIKWTPWIRVVESDMVPKTRIVGNLYLPIDQEKTEPIAGRIIEVRRCRHARPFAIPARASSPTFPRSFEKVATSHTRHAGLRNRSCRETTRA